jgi:hypothetical protein
MEATVISKIIEASPYLGFVLLFMWFEARREDKRITNAAALESRRENHERLMQERQIKHDNEINTLWAGYIQSIVAEIKAGNTALINKLEEHDSASSKRYERLGITGDLLKIAQEKSREKR